MKKKHLLLFVILTLSSFSIQAQDCLPNGITFSSQSQINNFHNDYPGCINIEGDLVIEGYSDIVNLEGLLGIEYIGGSLVIVSENNLSSLSGLDSLKEIEYSLYIEGSLALTSLQSMNQLESIGGRFHFFGNNFVESFNGLSKLKYIGGEFRIGGNASLINFTGLENLEYIGYSCDYTTGYICTGLIISSNASLINLEGLEGISQITSTLEISGNPNLIALTGLDQLTIIKESFKFINNDKIKNFESLNQLSEIDGLFWVNFNEALENFQGLDSLHTIDGEDSSSPNPYESIKGFVIANNSSLKDFTGLENLKEISKGGLEIYNNESLINLQGLQQVEAIGYDQFNAYNVRIQGNNSLNSLNGLGDMSNTMLPYFVIQSNPILSDCAVIPVCNEITNGDHVIVGNNALGCDQNSEVEIACQTISTSEISFNQELIQFFPIPFQQIVNIEIQDPLKKEALTLKIYNQFGQEVITKNLLGSDFYQLESQGLMPGIYYYYLLGPKETLLSIGKLIKAH